ncbi:tetratricopeptide repeat protein [Ideonella sp. A 288]|uniref:tetratricopeptide repeat protein n=1 Tax=Ideonella sp. A 288 TaxID=1962181 RepID=UPI001F1C34B1|nr:tetratricopeptide repeat protein [Ideonella sp. A 288]
MKRSKWVRGASWRAALAGAAWAWCASAAAATEPPQNSSLDAPLFYQLLIGEIELRSGRAGNAYEVILDAARRSNDPALFQRAVEIALQGRAGDQALAAARFWRQAVPTSTDALRYQTQLLLALNRIDEMAEPLAAWLAGASVIERPGLIAALPRILQRASDRAKASAVVESVLLPYRDAPETRVSSLVASGRMALAAGQADQALALARRAHDDEPSASGPALLALDLLPGLPEAERLVTAYFARPGAEPAVRLAYVRMLTQSQRYADAIAQLEIVTRDKAELPEPWLTLGALHIELKHPREGEAALKRFIQLAGNELPVAPAPVAPSAAAAAADDNDDDEPAPAPSPQPRDLTQAWLLLSQAAEMQGDMVASEAWLAKVDSPQRALEVQSRRATLLARQGKVAQARAMIQSAPERTGDDARAKLLAEAQMLREVKLWREASDVLQTANQRHPNDADLLYEQAMIEDKLERYDDMERLLRRVIELKPDHPHAHNALGYSLADRKVRLPEARDLIRKALALSPGDPFITDSLGWVEFRLGNGDEALRLLRQAWSSRPDTEIGAHLGEVLWALGQQDEARRIWREARGRDAANEVLRETLARLKVGL